MPADKPISGYFRMIPYQLNGQDLPRSQFFAHSLLRHHLLSRIKAAVHKSIPERITPFHMGPKVNKSITTTMVSEIWLYERNGNLGAGSFTWHSGTISGAEPFSPHHEQSRLLSTGLPWPLSTVPTSQSVLYLLPQRCYLFLQRSRPGAK